MRIKYLTNVLVLFFFYTFCFVDAWGKINNSIVAKVGNQVITNADLKNEIKTILILSKRNIDQSSIDSVKNIAIKSLVRNLIKKNEIKKNKITNYASKELEQYLSRISDSLGIDRSNLKSVFKKNNLDYDFFIEKNKTELIWKTLIYTVYKNQININTIEVENEMKKKVKNNVEYELSEIEISTNNKNIQKLLKDIYKMIETDGFQKTAKKFSISNSASKGGKIGFFSEKILSEIYLSELKKIKSGEITQPIKNSNSLIILKIESVKATENKDFDLNKMREEIIARKKEEKLDLFSRSHFLNIENQTLVKFQ